MEKERLSGVWVFYRKPPSIAYRSFTNGSDHTIVTSDSLGSVTFWDGASMAQKQHFQAHKADGMCLLIGPVSVPPLSPLPSSPPPVPPSSPRKSG